MWRAHPIHERRLDHLQIEEYVFKLRPNKHDRYSFLEHSCWCQGGPFCDEYMRSFAEEYWIFATLCWNENGLYGFHHTPSGLYDQVMGYESKQHDNL